MPVWGRKVPIQMVWNGEAGESGAVKAVVQREKTEAAVEGMSADQKIGTSAPRPGAVLSSKPGNIILERAAGNTPNTFVQLPINRDSCISEEDPPFKIRKVGHPKKAK